MDSMLFQLSMQNKSRKTGFIGSIDGGSSKVLSKVVERELVGMLLSSIS